MTAKLGTQIAEATGDDDGAATAAAATTTTGGGAAHALLLSCLSTTILDDRNHHVACLLSFALLRRWRCDGGEVEVNDVSYRTMTYFGCITIWREH